uniref:Uncharacterized protein n=1 Tax=viral metagenome TaxID=1070528 RepID=A0A6C0C0P9_9ZZZZ
MKSPTRKDAKNSLRKFGKTRKRSRAATSNALQKVPRSIMHPADARRPTPLINAVA